MAADLRQRHAFPTMYATRTLGQRSYLNNSTQGAPQGDFDFRESQASSDHFRSLFPTNKRTVDLSSELKLSTNARDREKYDNLADLYSIIVTTDYLEKAYVRNTISPQECVGFPVVCVMIRLNPFDDQVRGGMSQVDLSISHGAQHCSTAPYSGYFRVLGRVPGTPFCLLFCFVYSFFLMA